jgi:ureidoacrylate peracid hydrolase
LWPELEVREKALIVDKTRLGAFVPGSSGNATNTDAEHNATLTNMVRLFADVMTTEEFVGFLQSSSASSHEAAE